MDTEQKLLSRRRFLALATRIALGLAGALGLVGLVRFFSHTPGSNRKQVFDLGPVSEFPDSGKLYRPDIPAVIFRTSSSYRGMSLICTHLGCIVDENQSGYSCPCHGSTFSSDGSLIHGPAAKDLPELKVELTAEGHLLLHTEGAGL